MSKHMPTNKYGREGPPTMDDLRIMLSDAEAEVVALREALRFPRNTRWEPRKMLHGNWICVPLEDFERSQAARTDATATAQSITTRLQAEGRAEGWQEMREVAEKVAQDFIAAESIRAESNREAGRLLHGNECEHGSLIATRIAAAIRALPDESPK